MNTVSQYIQQTVNTDFAKPAKNVSVKNLFKRLNQIAVITILQLLLTPRFIKHV